MADGVVTQVAVEILRGPDTNKGYTTQLAVEILRDSPSGVVVTQLAVEILREQLAPSHCVIAIMG